MPKKIETEARASLKTCRALINRIEAGLSAEELIVKVSSAGELLFYLEFAASVLQKSAAHPRTLHLDFPSRMYLPRFGGAFLLARRYPNPRRPELPCFDEGTHSGDRGPPHDGTLSKK